MILSESYNFEKKNNSFISYIFTGDFGTGRYGVENVYQDTV